MSDHYNISKIKGRKNPHTKHPNKPVMIRLGRETVNTKSMAEETGTAYQTLFNLHLRNCTDHPHKLKIKLEF